ncbi:hypothetical protein P691DRAFT_765962 [Macrolepiota fuliginosa MF-IS2]|uniref:Uncharacterized protein n=1 Tax=Macrolepiota fuliginosa MF-IS2 TaxID=1400762 RepID=A0A9P5X0F6_9AGAR|nr:hypothetical protein P691DRAFT_765962 [Macrolepiota fuliginosa MF-IS2]
MFKQIVPYLPWLAPVRLLATYLPVTEGESLLQILALGMKNPLPTTGVSLLEGIQWYITQWMKHLKNVHSETIIMYPGMIPNQTDLIIDHSDASIPLCTSSRTVLATPCLSLPVQIPTEEFTTPLNHINPLVIQKKKNPKETQNLSKQSMFLLEDSDKENQPPSHLDYPITQDEPDPLPTHPTKMPTTTTTKIPSLMLEADSQIKEEVEMEFDLKEESNDMNPH